MMRILLFLAVLIYSTGAAAVQSCRWTIGVHIGPYNVTTAGATLTLSDVQSALAALIPGTIQSGSIVFDGYSVPVGATVGSSSFDYVAADGTNWASRPIVATCDEPSTGKDCSAATGPMYGMTWAEGGPYTACIDGCVYQASSIGCADGVCSGTGTGSGSACSGAEGVPTNPGTPTDPGTGGTGGAGGTGGTDGTGGTGGTDGTGGTGGTTGGTSGGSGGAGTSVDMGPVVTAVNAVAAKVDSGTVAVTQALEVIRGVVVQSGRDVVDSVTALGDRVVGSVDAVRSAIGDQTAQLGVYFGVLGDRVVNGLGDVANAVDRLGVDLGNFMRGEESDYAAKGRAVDGNGENPLATPDEVDVSGMLHTDVSGGGSCPAPHVFSVLGKEITYSFDRVCEWADIVGKVIMILAAFVSLRILAV